LTWNNIHISIDYNGLLSFGCDADCRMTKMCNQAANDYSSTAKTNSGKQCWWLELLLADNYHIPQQFQYLIKLYVLTVQ
jgi:hypothetical protein